MGRLKRCAGAGVLHEGSDIDSNVEEVPLSGGLQPFNPTCLALSAPASAQGAGMPGLGSPWSILSRSLLSDGQLAGSTPQHSEAAAAHISSPAAARGAAADFSSTAAAEAVLQALDCWAWQPSSFESSAAGSSTPGVFKHLILAASRGVRLPCTLPGGSKMQTELSRPLLPMQSMHCTPCQAVLVASVCGSCSAFGHIWSQPWPS